MIAEGGSFGPKGPASLNASPDVGSDATSRRIHAVILAAGTNFRFRETHGEGFHKQTLAVDRLPLVIRTVQQLSDGGVARIVIVSGGNHDSLVGLLSEHALLDRVEFIRNAYPERGNGYSLMLAKTVLDSPFFLLMSDHVYDEKFLRIAADTVANSPSHLDPFLLVDPKVESIYDLADATKVKTDKIGRIVAIGKELSDYDRVDTGFFLITPEFLKESSFLLDTQESFSISGMITHYITHYPFGTVDHPTAVWQDVDNVAMYEQARRLFEE